jgi:hypothetical protein
MDELITMDNNGAQVIYTPLIFWFNNVFDEQKFLHTYPGYSDILESLTFLNENNNLNDLISLVDKLEKLQNAYMKAANIQVFELGFGPGLFRQSISDVVNRINMIAHQQYGYNSIISLKTGEEMNGYNINDDKVVDFMMPFHVYMEWHAIWNDKEYDNITYEEFSEMFDETACSDWGKMDEYGNSYSGFWKYPEESEERQNAYSLSLDYNCKALYNLPYPKKFILHTIKIGCGNRRESVSYSNFLCEAMHQQIIGINTEISNKKLILITILLNKYNINNHIIQLILNITNDWKFPIQL